MFRGKESLNRIELSRLVQDLLNFAVLGSLRLWGGGRWVGGCQGHLGAWGGVPPHTHMHTHARTRTYTHVYMYRNCKWLPTWEVSMFSMISMFNMHVRACVHVHVCVHGTPPHTPIPNPIPMHPSATPPPPRGVDP